MMDLMGGMDAATLARITYMQNPNMDPSAFLGKLDSFMGPGQAAFSEGMKMPMGGSGGLGLQPPSGVGQPPQIGLGNPTPSGGVAAMGAPAPQQFNPQFMANAMKMLGGQGQPPLPSPGDPGGNPAGGQKAPQQQVQPIRHAAGPSLGMLLSQLRGQR